MKKRIGISVICIAISVALVYAACIGRSRVADFNSLDGFDEYLNNADITKITNKIKSEGCILNEKTAVAVAEAILDEKYGDTVRKPLKARFTEEYDAWQVCGEELPEGYFGGNVYIMLSRKNGGVMAIWATK